MRRLLVSLGLLLAPTAGATAAEPPLLKLVEHARGPDTLVRVDARTLGPVSRGLPIFRDSGGFAFSPDGRYVALGEGFDRPARLHVVDLELWRVVREVGFAGRSPVRPLAWLADGRLAVSLGWGYDRVSVAVLDPLAGAVLSRATLPGQALAGPVRAGSELVWLAGKPRQLGPARLLAFDLDGGARALPLSGIRAGSGVGPRQHGRDRIPALVAGPDGARAYVIAAAAPLVAEVALASGAVTHHRLRTGGSAPTAAKEPPFDSAFRDGQLLESGMIAVSGEYRRYGRRRLASLRSYGLQAIDPRDWSASLLDPEPSSITSTPGAVLAVGRAGADWDRRGRRDAGLTALDANARIAFRRFPGEDVSVYGITASHAYVWVRRTRRLHTLDLATGRTLFSRRTPPFRVPVLLSPGSPVPAPAAAPQAR